MTVEDELLKVSQFKKKTKGKSFEDRQDYLASLLKVIDSNVTDDQYDNLSDEAVDWHKAAADAMNAQEEIPDFEELKGEETDSDAEETEAEATEAGGEEDGEGGSDNDRAEPESVESDPKPKSGAKGKAAKVKAPAKAPAAGKPPGKPARKSPDYTSLTGEKDRFGVVKGTKTAEAVAMYVKGVTAKQITDELGGRYYNILTRLTKEGHRVEKLADNVWKLTHKDDLKKGK
jgi:hypothetical protein